MRSLSKAARDSIKPGHKYVKRVKKNQSWRYKYKAVLADKRGPVDDFSLLDKATADTIRSVIKQETAVGGPLKMGAVRYLDPQPGSKVLMWTDGSNLFYTSEVMGDIDELPKFRDSIGAWLNRIDFHFLMNGQQEGGITLTKIKKVMETRKQLGYKTLPALTTYLDRPGFDKFDKQEVILRAVTHELGHIRMDTMSRSAKAAFSVLIDTVEIAAQLPSEYAMESISEAFAEAFAVYRLNLQSEGKIALPPELIDFFDSTLPGGY